MTLNPQLPIAGVGTLEQAVHAAKAGSRFTAVVLGVFAIVALVLSAVGVYGVTLWVVERRTREISLRIALGASRTQIVVTVMKRIGQMLCVGVVSGLALAVLTTLAASRFVFEWRPVDPLMLVISAFLLALTGVSAGAMATHRAIRTGTCQLSVAVQ